jgi:acyl-CoA synthetase (AMP-forming)/AMP-acid ligase II
MATNSEAQVLLLLALAHLGAIAVPVNPDSNATEAGYIFRHAEAAVVACTSAALPAARAACGELPNPPWFLVLDGELAPANFDGTGRQRTRLSDRTAPILEACG